ncbi:sugar phosphatase [Escherichia coli]|nr:sugar phosphatase [Escherichia coli]
MAGKFEADIAPEFMLPGQNEAAETQGITALHGAIGDRKHLDHYGTTSASVLFYSVSGTSAVENEVWRIQ